MSQVMDTLLALSRVDEQLVKLKRILDAGPEELRLKQEAIDAAIKARSDAEGAIRASATRVDQCNLDIRSAEVEAEDQAEKLKIVKNNKEFKIITKRIKDLKQLIADKESTAIRMMDETDSLRADLEAKNVAVAAAEAALIDVQKRLEGENGSIHDQQLALVAQRKECIKKIEAVDPDAMGVYRSALSRGKGQAISEMVGGVCQTCYMKQSPNIENTVLIGKDIQNARCIGCGRILVPGAAEIEKQQS